MFPKRILLISMGLVCLSQFPAAAAAQTFITAWGSGDMPTGVAVGGSGDIYVSDDSNGGVAVYTRDGTYLRGWGVPYQSDKGVPNIAVDANDNVYVVSTADREVYRFTSTGVLVTQWQVDLGSSACLTVDASGNVYVTNHDRVSVFTPSGVLVREWGASGTGPGQFSFPDGLAIDASGNVYVADRDNHRVQKFTSTGTYLTQWGSLGSANGQFIHPVRVAIGPQGTVYVVDNGNYRVEVFTAEGAFMTKWGNAGTSPGQFDNPIGIAVDSSGDIYVADTYNARIQKFGFAPTPVVSVTWGSMKARYRAERAVAQGTAQGR